MSDGGPDTEGTEVDPRRAMWRRGSYEIAGDWVADASVSVLDRVEQVTGAPLRGKRFLDVATGTGAVAIAAARRGAAVTAVDITDELIEIAERRAGESGVEVRFLVGDFDRLDEVLGSQQFDVVTSSLGVIFAPDPPATLAGLGRRLAPGGVIGVVGWDPDSVLMVPESMLELLPERPAMLDMGTWTTGIATLCEGSGFQVASTAAEDLIIPFASAADAADQLERWSGGFAQMLATFDGLGVGDEARARFVDHLDGFATPADDGIGLRARYHVSVLRRAD